MTVVWIVCGDVFFLMPLQEGTHYKSGGDVHTIFGKINAIVTLKEGPPLKSWILLAIQFFILIH